MASFSIDTNSPFAEEELRRILEEFRQNPKLEVLEDENRVRVIEVRKDNLETMLPGKPMTEEELEARLEKSEQDYSAGKFRSVDELLAEVKRGSTL